MDTVDRKKSIVKISPLEKVFIFLETDSGRRSAKVGGVTLEGLLHCTYSTSVVVILKIPVKEFSTYSLQPS